MCGKEGDLSAGGRARFLFSVDLPPNRESKMVFCLLCFDDAPIDDDPRAVFAREWETGLQDACCASPLCCLCGLTCPHATAYHLRQQVLGPGNMSQYKCCQGYFDCCCFRAGTLGEEQCPEAYLCVEAFCCTHFATQANRFYMMDTRDIKPDPCDNRLVRCHNCMQCAACLFELAAYFSGSEDVQDAAGVLRCIADCMYVSIMSCMAAQVQAELDAEKAGRKPAPHAAPRNLEMQRVGSGPPNRHGQQMVTQPVPATMHMPPQPQPMAAAYPGQQPPPVAMAQPMAVAQPQPQPFLVGVPQGMGPGQQMMVQSPFTGQQLAVVVPPGVGPGMQFQVMG